MVEALEVQADFSAHRDGASDGTLIPSQPLITDDIILAQTRINPDLLSYSPEAPREIILVDGKPPGYMSHGDWIVLERYSGRGFIHDRGCHECSNK